MKKKEIDYKKLRPDVLSDLVANRGIECHNTRTDMIRKLKMDDAGVYIRETYIEKFGKDEYLIGVDLKSHNTLVKLSQQITNGNVKNANMYFNNRIHFITKLTLEQLGL